MWVATAVTRCRVGGMSQCINRAISRLTAACACKVRVMLSLSPAPPLVSFKISKGRKSCQGGGGGRITQSVGGCSEPGDRGVTAEREKTVGCSISWNAACAGAMRDTGRRFACRAKGVLAIYGGMKATPLVFGLCFVFFSFPFPSRGRSPKGFQCLNRYRSLLSTTGRPQKARTC